MQKMEKSKLLKGTNFPKQAVWHLQLNCACAVDSNVSLALVPHFPICENMDI